MLNTDKSIVLNQSVDNFFFPVDNIFDLRQLPYPHRCLNGNELDLIIEIKRIGRSSLTG